MRKGKVTITQFGRMGAKARKKEIPFPTVKEAK